MTQEKEKSYYQNKIRENTDDMAWMAIPGAEWALTPDWSVFYDDISDKKQFNERFIESRVAIGGMASALKLFAFMFFLTVFWFVIDTIFYGEFISDPTSFFMMSAMTVITGLFFTIAFLHSRPAPVRFNRQAQLVHVTTLPKRDVVTVPWKDVHPFIHFSRDTSGWYNLKLLFPVRKPDKNKKINEPLEVPGSFSSLDNTFPTEAISRWEFIRSYMENGLAGIQPDKKAADKGELDKLSGFTKEVIAGEEHFTTKIWYLIEIILVFPILLERIVKEREKKFRWPEEVERLCAPDADLSHLDTHPISSHKDRYYLLDEHKGIIWGTEDEFRARGLATKSNS